MTEGKKRVVCPKCRQSMCYLCGVAWKEGNKFKHTCGMKAKIEELEREFEGEEKCCDCEECCSKCRCDCDCCECCDSLDCDVDFTCNSCRKCDRYDFCCEILFYYGGRCHLGCIIWNLISIPMRIAVSALNIAFYLSIFFVGIAALTFACIMGAVCAGIFVGPCKICEDNKGTCIPFLVLLFYPFLVLYFIFVFII